MATLIKKKEDDWQKVSGELFRFNKSGDSVEGKLLSKEDSAVFPGRKTYDIETNDGTIQRVLGTVVIDRMLASLELGSSVKIAFKGITPSKSGRPVKDFEVYTKG